MRAVHLLVARSAQPHVGRRTQETASATRRQGMRRKISIGVVLTLLAAATITWSLAAPFAQEPPTGVYLALGDSLAAGVGATRPTESGYVSQLFTALQANGDGITELDNLAISGETTTSILDHGQLDRAMAAIADPANDV